MDLHVPDGAVDVDDSCDSSSDIAKPDYPEPGNYDSQAESGSESQADFAEIGMRNAVSSGLTMKEYEEQLKKLTAENFNLKLRVYFVEERLSKVTGISDKEDLIKKNIQLKVTCESQLKELEKKQELLFEASKAFELLQREHAEEVERLTKDKDKEIGDLEEKLTKLEASHNELKSRCPDNSDSDFKTFEDYEKQINELEAHLRDEEDRYKELENILKDSQMELESFRLKSQRVESELDQRMRRIEELVDELEQKERDLASANFRIRKLEDELKSKQREDEIMKERIEEKNKTIDSLKSSLASRDETIEVLENRVAKERSSSQTLQSKTDSLSFQNARLKEELEILQSRLRRTAESLSPRGKGRSVEEDFYKQKYEETLRAMDEQEGQHAKRVKELEEKLFEKDAEAEDYQELFEKHKKLEDDHRKACTALKNFIKRSSEEKKEREALNQMLNNHEEVIAELKAQLDQYRSDPLVRPAQDDKLSLAGTGDNDRMFGCAAAEKDSSALENNIDQCSSSSVSVAEAKDAECKVPSWVAGVQEKAEKVSELEAEVLALKFHLESQSSVDPEGKISTDQVLADELESKKSEIEKLNGELKRRNISLQGVVNKELWDKNRQIEKLENRLVKMSKLDRDEIESLYHKIGAKDRQLKALQNKMQDFGISADGEVLSKETGSSSDWSREASGDRIFSLADENPSEEFCGSKEDPRSSVSYLQAECAKAKERACKAEEVRKEAAETCALLSSRLEELAGFLDSLLSDPDLLAGIEPKKWQDVKQAMEKSRELSRRLSLSFARRNVGDLSLAWSSLETTHLVDAYFFQNDSPSILLSRDKVISEQTVIINRLRDQLKLLSQEIKQRDIELSHCRGDFEFSFSGDALNRNSSETGIDGQSMSICQEISDEESPDDAENKGVGEKEAVVVAPATSFFSKASKKSSGLPHEEKSSRETSESEAWSEPDRSVSLARMGRLEEPVVNTSLRNSRCEDSSESSEETLNESSKNSVLGKRCRSSESEVRRLHSRIKSLDEANENLRSEIILLKSGKVDSGCASRIQKNEEANLVEKLRKTMGRLEECSLACRQLEEKLAGALERASTSAMQLSKAQDTIAQLEQEIERLKEEIGAKNLESREKARRIAELENKIEEMTIETELKIMEAVKEKEAAERKTLEVEWRLKDAENTSKEVETRVNEIEKKISETKRFKRETVLHFKEAEKHVDTAEKMMEEAEKIKSDAERKSKDFQDFIDLMRKEVEEKMKEADKRIKKSEKEKEDLEKQVLKLRKRLMEAEKNKTEVETKVKEGKETIQCMEEKLKELEIAMDQCGEEAQRKIKEMQKKADAKVAELEMKIEEREWVRKIETERKMAEAEKLSKELEVGFKRQLEDAEKKVKKAKENAELAIRKVEEDAKRQEAELLQKISLIEAERKAECGELRRQIEEARLESSEFELELTKLTNEKIHLEEELKRMLDKECALVRDNKEIKGKYENSIHELENKLTRLTLNKSQLASRLEEIESTNIDLVSRISAIRAKESAIVERDFSSGFTLSCSPPPGPFAGAFFGEVDVCLPPDTDADGYADEPFARLGDRPRGARSADAFGPSRRNANSSSPDLGIDSDPGRFSSLEANPQGATDRPAPSGISESVEIRKLECENAELRRRLMRTRQALEETLTQLSAANQRKKQVERAICKQLHKTHHILKKARVNFEAPDEEEDENEDTGESEGVAEGALA